MRRLIIPDVHHKVHTVDKILTKESYDEVIFLGDFFDDWGDTTAHAICTAEWIKAHSQEPHWTWLWGNHDIMYRFPRVPHLRCSGHSPEKAKVIQEVLRPIDWDHWRMFDIADGWLVSHAGLHPGWAHPVHGVAWEWLRVLEDSCLTTLRDGRMHAFADAGPDRWSQARIPYGGILWMDWASLKPIPGLNQLTGHTNARKVRHKNIADSQNCCLDTNLRHYAVIENGALEVKEVKELLG